MHFQMSTEQGVNFGGLAAGCVEADLWRQIAVFQYLSRSKNVVAQISEIQTISSKRVVIFETMLGFILSNSLFFEPNLMTWSSFEIPRDFRNHYDSKMGVWIFSIKHGTRRYTAANDYFEENHYRGTIHCFDIDSSDCRVCSKNHMFGAF